jgi:hypothetical protein
MTHSTKGEDMAHGAKQSGLLSLTRTEHDELLARNPAICTELFNVAASREWSLSGVMFYGIPQSLINRVIDAMVQ